MSPAFAGRAGRSALRLLLALALTAGGSACSPADAPPAESPAPDAAADSSAAAAAAPDSIVDGEHAASGTVPMRVFFFRGERIAETVRAVRPASDLLSAEDTLRTALAALLAGPDAADRAAGLTSFFSDDTRDRLRDVRVEHDVAVVDFHDFSRVIPNASSSLGSTMLLDALNATVFANAGVAAVEYRFDGSCDRFGEWVQRGCVRYERDR